MSTSRHVVVVLSCLGSIGSAWADNNTPSLGTAPSPAELSTADITIMPDGEGLPPGSGNAVSGALIYERTCSACHGDKGIGGISDVLVGGLGSLTGSKPLQTVGSYWPYATTLFDYVRRAMPYQNPGSLSTDEVYAVTAYLLRLNGIIGESESIDATTLPKVRMPNSGNFDWAYESPR